MVASAPGSVNDTGRMEASRPRRSARQVVAEHVSARPPPAAGLDRIVYGLIQPLLGARMLLSDRELLVAALIPAALLAGVCAVVAVLGPPHKLFETFYTTFALLAPLPSVILAHHYARLAVLARHKLGFSRAEPCLESLRRNLGRAVKQAIIIALALAPVSALLGAIPEVGGVLARAVAAVWALHWVVVDAFDSARYLRPGQTIADLDAEAQRDPVALVRALAPARRRQDPDRRTPGRAFRAFVRSPVPALARGDRAASRSTPRSCSASRSRRRRSWRSRS